MRTDILYKKANELLTDEDKLYIKEWVKENFIPNSFPNAFWNQYVKTEWNKQQQRHELAEKLKKLDRESKIE